VGYDRILSDHPKPANEPQNQPTRSGVWDIDTRGRLVASVCMADVLNEEKKQPNIPKTPVYFRADLGHGVRGEIKRERWVTTRTSARRYCLSAARIMVLRDQRGTR
jgi:hypothetical protein